MKVLDPQPVKVVLDAEVQEAEVKVSTAP